MLCIFNFKNPRHLYKKKKKVMLPELRYIHIWKKVLRKILIIPWERLHQLFLRASWTQISHKHCGTWGTGLQFPRNISHGSQYWKLNKIQKGVHYQYRHTKKLQKFGEWSFLCSISWLGRNSIPARVLLLVISQWAVTEQINCKQLGKFKNLISN